MADLLDAVVDIHDKLHMDVLFNPSRDSSSSSVTIQSKSFIRININYLTHDSKSSLITFGKINEFLCILRYSSAFR